MTNTTSEEYIALSDGSRYYYGNINTLSIGVISSHLSKISRFAGGTAGDYPYSVAQHAVLVENIMCEAAPTNYLLRLYALHHDDHEMVMSDIPTPFQRWIGKEPIAKAKDIIDMDIWYNLNVPQLPPYYIPIIKWADRMAFAVEMHTIMEYKTNEQRPDERYLRHLSEIQHAPEARARFELLHYKLYDLWRRFPNPGFPPIEAGVA